MTKLNLRTSEQIIPMIYAYSTPEIARHAGWVKIGYTEKQTVESRIKEQTHTSGVSPKLEWKGSAVYDDGTSDCFKDFDFHRFLEKLNVEREEGTEWFHIDGPTAKAYFDEFRQRRGIASRTELVPYKLRDEQFDAVELTRIYAKDHPRGEFLWNAKPRFGKTLAVYDLIKQLKVRSALILTNRPAVANSWYDDYERFIGTKDKYYFVSSNPALAKKPSVLTPEQFDAFCRGAEDGEIKRIEFVSLQDLKGSIHFGGAFAKLEHLTQIEWDLLVIDEAHEGVDTYKTDLAFSNIVRNFTLHLSGTPFKALANDKFPEKAIYNWTYADEQRAKKKAAEASPDTGNPYAELPQLRLYTYQASEMVRDIVEKGTEIDGEQVEYAFDLNMFFSTKKSGGFVYNDSVDRFLDALATQEKFPFSTPELRDELRHTFWLLDRVDSAKALAKKLKAHPVFSEYEIVLAAGDGKLDEETENARSLDRVRKAIKESGKKTITLSVGQLTTGVTVPEWSAVLMLSNVKSPALYMQAAFRAQNPYVRREGNLIKRKEAAYVFDFDPARTLTIYETFANDLYSATSAGRGALDERRENVRQALNFFPVVGEDENGEMIELSAEQVLSIPRKIRSREVVRRCFMCNFLFQNISAVFSAPSEVVNLINRLQPFQEQSKKKVEDVGIDENTASELSLNEDGEVELGSDIVVGTAQNLFGDKIYEEISDKIEEAVEEVREETRDSEEEIARLRDAFKAEIADPLIDQAQEHYGKEMREKDKSVIRKKLADKADKALNLALGQERIARNKIEREKEDALEAASTPEERAEAIRVFEEKEEKIVSETRERLVETAMNFADEAAKDVVSIVETQRREREKSGIENKIRDHLRGFSRTIPSFLMAYGDRCPTLENFDQIIPAYVFKEVTGITVEEFAFLRDGGDYKDETTGETRRFPGNLFDPVVFNDSVKEFVALKARLGNYLDENLKEDIFDYVPPQRTNQIFTPKAVVKRMVDLLEQENPGCFDQDDKTFADLYMKSGQYVAEIVRRLYASPVMKKLHPDDAERKRHILEKQVYGLAPTEIIWRIAVGYIFGIDPEGKISRDHFRQLDALEYSKSGKLQEKIDELFD